MSTVNSNIDYDLWSDERISYIKTALRNNEDAQDMFSEMVDNVLGTKTENDKNPFDYVVMSQFLPGSYICFYHCMIPKLGESYNTNMISYIDFSKIDFSDVSLINKLVEYPLLNLKTLHIKGCKNVSNFTEAFFCPDNKDYLVSLIKIQADDSDIADKDLNIIFDHFESYKHFVRDSRQFSAMFSIPAVFLNIELCNCPNIEKTRDRLPPKKLNTRANSYFRSQESSHNGPLIITFDT
jgi:hypothetical protein